MPITIIQPLDKVAESRDIINANFATLFAMISAGFSGSTSLNFPSIPRGEYAELSFAAIGAIPGQPVSIGAPAALEAGLSVGAAWASAVDQISVRLLNSISTGVAVNPAIATYTWATGLTGAFRGSGILSSPAIPRGESVDLILFAPGVTSGQPVTVGAPNLLESGISYSAWSSAVNVITIRATNSIPTGLPVTMAARTWTWVQF